MNTEKESREVTKMTATSTTSSRDTPEPITEPETETKKRKKKKLSKEQKEQELRHVDNVKTMKRIFYELPKGNWLEEKIKDLETKNTEEQRRNSLDRMIEEELSRRKSITNNMEKDSPASTDLKENNTSRMEIREDSSRDNTLSPPPPLDTPENLVKESRDEQIFVEIQEELNQQKDCLLKDIRLIQKKKIKEMEELYELKLKKKTYEQELEDTKLEIKRMDEHFEFLRKKKAELSGSKVPESHEAERQKVDNGQDVKIIDNKRPAPPTQPVRDDISVVEETFPRPKYSCSSVRVRTNLVESSGLHSAPPPYYGHGGSKDKQGGQKQLSKYADSQPQAEQGMPTLLHQKSLGQDENPKDPPPYTKSASPALSHPPQRPSSRPTFDNTELQRIQEEARQSFQPYKPHRRPEVGTGSYFVPQLREYKDAILIPVRSGETVPPLLEPQYRGVHLPGLSYPSLHHIHHYDPAYNPHPIRPTPVTPHRNVPLNANISRLAEMSQPDVGAGLVRPLASSVSGAKLEKYLAANHQLQDQRKAGQEQQLVTARKPGANSDVCEGCGKEANFMCSACRGAHYCSTECQRDLWASHSKHCKIQTSTTIN